MEITAIYRCVAALDVHQSKLTVCILYENESGEIITELKEFGGFKRDPGPWQIGWSPSSRSWW